MHTYAPRDITSKLVAQDSNPTWKPRPATNSQMEFISSLMKSRGLEATQLLAVFPNRPETVKEASKVIDWLKAQPKAAPSQPSSPQEVDGLTGYFCIQLDSQDKPHFYRVKQGFRPGIVFVSEQASGFFYSVKPGSYRNSVLGAILADPKLAGQRYAQEIGRCYRCHRVLTDQNNPYFPFGLGPDCGTQA